MSDTVTSTPEGLTISSRIEERLSKGELTREQVDDFQAFLRQVDRELMQHRVITNNEYTRWFQQGDISEDHLRHFITQFSVFSNLFLIAALKKVINAPSLEQARASKEILLNELGVIYRKHEQKIGERAALSDAEKDREGDPDLVSIEGTIDGGVFRFRAAHFEWLLTIGQQLGLTFNDMGKRRHGTKSTLHFCDELSRCYGSDDGPFAEGASFAIENWAAAGFWQELEDGLMKINEKRSPKLKLAFFTWHNRVEAQHAEHTLEELEEVYFGEEELDKEKFFQGGREILDACAEFWDGLNKDRKN